MKMRNAALATVAEIKLMYSFVYIFILFQLAFIQFFFKLTIIIRYTYTCTFCSPQTDISELECHVTFIYIL